jgi:hypothetical protein
MRLVFLSMNWYTPVGSSDMLPTLVRPLDFQRRNRDIFRTYSAFRYYLDHRHENGLVASGAIIETAVGLRVVPEKFPGWLLKQPQPQPNGNAG